tara:strand:+ start:685 stop:1497 length:813 start_codon:yes stop_codon:yes gene_type:complete
MPSFVGSPISSWFKRVFQINQSSNAGVDGTLRSLQSGDGVDSSVKLSTNALQVQPTGSNGTSLDVKNLSGSSILSVSTSDSVTTSGANAYNVHSSFIEFGVLDMACTEDTHHPLAAPGVNLHGVEDFSELDNFGTSDSGPSATLDFSAVTGNNEQLTAAMWYVPYNMKIDEVRYWAHSSDSSAIDTTFSLYKYTLDTSSNHGDLSSGTKLASLAVGSPIALINTKVYTGTLTLESDTTVNAGKILMAFVREQEASSNQFTGKLIVKYHLR